MSTTPEDQAREVAEARRRRILDSSEDRLGRVAMGDAYAPANSQSSQSQLAATTESTTSIVDHDAADAAAGDGEEMLRKSSSTGSSKLAAMRKRRFKRAAPDGKTDAAAAEATPTVTTSMTSMEVETTIPAITTEAVSPSLMTVKSVEEVTSVFTDPTESSATITNESVEQDEPSDTTTTATMTTRSQKKYQGVARMRRRMIKEQQISSSSDIPSQPVDASSAAAAVSSSSSYASTPRRTVAPKSVKSFAKVLPIYMYAVTALILFGVGLEIGLQQTTVPYHHLHSGEQQPRHNDNNIHTSLPMIRIHRYLAPRELGLQLFDEKFLERFGIRLTNQYVLDDETATASKRIKFPFGDDDHDESLLLTTPVGETDEFATAATVPLPKGASLDGPEKGNLDPIFGVDLDQLTRGPGLFQLVGRIAVSLHRVNLAIFYYTPKRLVSDLWTTIHLFIRMPPLLALLAMFVRQVLGKTVLGATLPEPTVSPEEQKDLLGMIKRFVSKFILSSYPTAARVYDAYTHLRSDMYIVLCGVLVGMAYVHTFASVVTEDDAAATKDTVVESLGGGTLDEL